MYVNEAMTTSLRTCCPGSSLHEIAQQMWEADCGSIPIVDQDNKPVGIVTDRDIAMAAMLNHKALWDLSASTVISGQKVRSCSQGATVEQCLQMMEDFGVRRILVTDDNDKLCGIMTLGDAMAVTTPEKSSRRDEKVPVDQMFGMLRKVSQHHQSAHHDVLQVS